MPHFKPGPFHFEILAAVALASCVSGSSYPELPPNPPGCESVVQRHQEDPGLPVDSPPRPMEILFPPGTDWRQEPDTIIVSMVVDETGVPLPGSIEVSGARLPVTRRNITKDVPGWRFIPARLGECWVPGPFFYSLTFR